MSTRLPSPRRTRTVYTALLSIAVLLIAQPVAAYHFFHVASGGSQLPVAWRTLPVGFIVDNTPSTFQTTVQSAFDTWNNVATARQIFGAITLSTADLTQTNYQTAGGWGFLNGDGRQEVVCDSTGQVLTLLGLSPTTTTGYGPSLRQVVGGQGAITDAFFVLNCSMTPGANFNPLATMVHELGHNIGLAHSSGYLDSAERLLPLSINDAPTMYPFVVTGNAAVKATLEADDIAGVSELYPDTTFAAAYSTISGQVTRCGTGDAVNGVNVRAVSTANSRVQITRYTGYDGNTSGRYSMKVPNGTYKLIIEVMNLPLDRMAMLTTVDDDFSTEYRSDATIESNCSEDMPDTGIDVAASGGGAVANQDFKTNPVELAFVVDDTGSMSPEIAAVRAALTAQISRLAAITTRPYPNTAIVSFKDDVTIRRVSRDPAVLQGVVNALVASGGGDCPESSNAALLAAGRLLRDGSQVMLFTDADSRYDGPSADTVAALYRSKGLRQSTLLSGSCSTVLSDPSTAADAAGMDPLRSRNPGNDASDEIPPNAPLGTQTSVQTFSSIAAATNGVMVAIPGIKTGNATERTRYVNVGTNIAVAATLPTVSTVLPGDGARGTTIDVVITGANTNFQSASVLSFSGTGITLNFRLVQSSTVMVANLSVASDATLGFRDVVVTTNLGGGALETATGVGAFNIIAAPTTPTITSVSPANVARGTTLDVTIRGVNTGFTAASVPIFCLSTCSSASSRDTTITVNSVSATSATALVANITIAAAATIAYRNVSVITGAQVATENVTGPFLVTATPLTIPRLTSVSPTSGNTGQTLTLTIGGENTSFADGVSRVGFSGTGITVNNAVVLNPRSLTANITISSGAAPGFRDIFVTTGGESAALLGGFNVVGGPPTAQPPTELYVASVVGNVVTFRWNAPLAGLTPTNYVIEGGLRAGEVLGSFPTNSTAPIFTVAAPTGSFFVRVHTISGTSRSTPSNEIMIHVNVPVTPSAPANLLAVRNGSAIGLAWRNTFTGGAPEAIVLDVTGSFNGSLMLPAGDSFFFDGVPNGTYTLSLRAVNAGGASPSSNSVTVSFPGACSGPPQAPADFLAYRIANTVYVLWNPAATGPAPTGYLLNVGGSFVGSLPTSGRALSGTVGPGRYDISVLATNACGASAATPVQSVVVP